MGAYLEGLVAARRQRLARMQDASPAPPRNVAQAARDDVAVIMARLRAVEERLAALAQWLPPPAADHAPSVRLRVSDIQRAVCRDYAVTLMELEGPSLSSAIVRARQVGMYLCRTLTADSYPHIARHFGDRGHTTALHAYSKIKRLREMDAELKCRLAALESELRDARAPVSDRRPNVRSQTGDIHEPAWTKAEAKRHPGRARQIKGRA